VEGVVDGKSEALGFLVGTLSRHRLVAPSFVETTQTRYFFDRVMGGYVDRQLRSSSNYNCALLFAVLTPGLINATRGHPATRRVVQEP
jgi:hypothetical protein